MECISIVLICDDNYILPTAVAIASMIENKQAESRYRIHIVAANLTEENETYLTKFSTSNVEINVIREDANRFSTLHTFDKNAICVASIAALLKFILPELLSEDKVLYLDGDILVKEDLSELFYSDIQESLAGVIIDSGSIYYKHQYTQMVNYYFNSGVMLLNLKKMRNEDITSKLIQTKTNLHDSNLMDQNVFNLVFDGQIKLLPIRYNLLPVNLERAEGKWGIEDINEIYNTAYKSKEELYANAAIIHYSSKDKPWKIPNIPFAADWFKMYLSIDSNKKIKRNKVGTYDIKDSRVTVVKRGNIQTPLVSVIVPVYNTEKYLTECLDSITHQTLPNIEILCINDGSTDGSLDILERYAEKDSRIWVFSQENMGQGAARNAGLRHARGKYIYYMDSDDLLEPNALETLSSRMEKDRLDMVFFDGSEFYDENDESLKGIIAESYYLRKNDYEGIYNGAELFSAMVANNEYRDSPCLQMALREFIIQNKLYFIEGIIHEDVHYTFQAILGASRTGYVHEALFSRRIRPGSTMTQSVSFANVYGRFICFLAMVKYCDDLGMQDNTGGVLCSSG